MLEYLGYRSAKKSKLQMRRSIVNVQLMFVKNRCLCKPRITAFGLKVKIRLNAVLV